MRRARTHEKKISPGLGEGREVKNMRETENELNWGEGRGHRYGGACVGGWKFHCNVGETGEKENGV